MGSKHLRLAVALLEEAHGDYMASAEAKNQIEEGLKGVDLETEELSTKVTIMKWRTCKGDEEWVLEFALAPEVRGVDTELVTVLVMNGGKEKHGAEARGPAIREVDEAIEHTWKHVSR